MFNTSSNIEIQGLFDFMIENIRAGDHNLSFIMNSESYFHKKGKLSNKQQNALDEIYSKIKKYSRLSDDQNKFNGDIEAIKDNFNTILELTEDSYVLRFVQSIKDQWDNKQFISPYQQYLLTSIFNSV